MEKKTKNSVKLEGMSSSGALGMLTQNPFGFKRIIINLDDLS